MGMYDTIESKHAKVGPGEFQTKDLICELCHFELREDGALVNVRQPLAEGPDKAVAFTGTGEVRFYKSGDESSTDWIEWSAYYSKGKLIHIEQISGA
jgi:hypothetical protein